MTELQQRLVEMLAAFHGICEQEGLRYYLLGGTALGAARHGGFIPWDDDIDVGMPRPDYEKLRMISQTADFGKYCFEFPGEAKDFVYPYGKMYDTTTTLVENTRYKTKRGIYIDVFPLDGAGETREASLAHFRKIEKKVNLLSTKVCAWRKGRKLYKNLALTAMHCVPEFIISSKKLKQTINDMAASVDYDSSRYVMNVAGNWHEREIIEKEWLGTPTLCEFDGIAVYTVENVDAYLTALYGDWRTPPPPEKQITHHDYLHLDLHTSYQQK